MTSGQEEHLKAVISDTSVAVDKKYRAGQEEHGGNLWRKPVINFMGDELTDHIVYFHVLKKQWAEMVRIAEEAIRRDLPGPEDLTDCDAALIRIYNILTVGNPEGVKEVGD